VLLAANKKNSWINPYIFLLVLNGWISVIISCLVECFVLYNINSKEKLQKQWSNETHQYRAVIIVSITHLLVGLLFMLNYFFVCNPFSQNLIFQEVLMTQWFRGCGV
jgi:hypothetical protein